MASDFLPCLPWVWSVYPPCTLGSEVSTCHVINVPGFHLFSKPVVTCALDSHQRIRGIRVCWQAVLSSQAFFLSLSLPCSILWTSIPVWCLTPDSYFLFQSFFCLHTILLLGLNVILRFSQITYLLPFPCSFPSEMLQKDNLLQGWLWDRPDLGWELRQTYQYAMCALCLVMSDSLWSQGR